MDFRTVDAQTSNETFKIPCPENTSEIIHRCQRDLSNLAMQGYPWYYLPESTSQNFSFKDKVKFNSSDATDLPGDPLDAVNHICEVLEKTETCLEESHVDPACLIVGNSLSSIDQSTFQFLCRKRDTNLLHSLQCLLDTRITTMLDFHILAECWNGVDILNTHMRRTKNALFYNLNVRPPQNTPALVNRFCCFPTDSLPTCVKPIIRQRCGDRTASMVLDYIKFVQDQYKKDLIRAGLNPDPCTINRSNYVTNAPKPDFGNYSFTTEQKSREFASKFNSVLVQEAPGTFLDTRFGHYVLEYIINISGEELCKPLGVYLAYGMCGFLADDVTEDTEFNILQYAHQLLPTWYHGTRCSNLNVFNACWQGLQTTCGEAASRGVKLHATLLAKSCALNDIMDTKQCKWQDMLLGPYIESSKKTKWPIQGQLPGDFFQLERAIYHGASLGNELIYAIHMLQPGVKKIARKCGIDAAANLTSLYKEIAYHTYDAITFMEWFNRHLR